MVLAGNWLGLTSEGILVPLVACFVRSSSGLRRTSVLSSSSRRTSVLLLLRFESMVLGLPSTRITLVLWRVDFSVYFVELDRW